MKLRWIDWFLKRRDPVAYWRRRGARIGSGCRLIDVDLGSEPWLVTIGDHVSATDTLFVTHDGGVWVFRQELPDIDVIKPIVVGDNVFLGARTIVMPGITIASNVVIGAGSVVTGDVAEGSVVAGVPGRVVSSLHAYREKCLLRAEYTKSMKAAEKRFFYLRKFGL